MCVITSKNDIIANYSEAVVPRQLTVADGMSDA
jgi:hypothetical protein